MRSFLVLKEFKIFYFVRKYFYISDMFDVVWEVIPESCTFVFKRLVTPVFAGSA